MCSYQEMRDDEYEQERGEGKNVRLKHFHRQIRFELLDFQCELGSLGNRVMNMFPTHQQKVPNSTIDSSTMMTDHLASRCSQAG
jgi:hypothetical protein